MKTADTASSMTGPVMDFKLQAHQAKLKVGDSDCTLQPALVSQQASVCAQTQYGSYQLLSCVFVP
jgi:hypothetical protein